MVSASTLRTVTCINAVFRSTHAFAVGLRVDVQLQRLFQQFDSKVENIISKNGEHRLLNIKVSTILVQLLDSDIVYSNVTQNINNVSEARS